MKSTGLVSTIEIGLYSFFHCFTAEFPNILDNEKFITMPKEAYKSE